MNGHGLFASEPIGNLFYLHEVMFEITKLYFIIKPPACWGADVSIEICQLLLLFSIITPCSNTPYFRCHVIYVNLLHHKIFSYLYFLKFFSWYFNQINRSSCPEVVCQKGVLKKLSKIHRKTPVPESLDVASWKVKVCNLIENSDTRVFQWIYEILRTAIS